MAKELYHKEIRIWGTRDFQGRWEEIFGGEERFLYRFDGRNGTKEAYVTGEGSACFLFFKNKVKVGCS